jgi:hypothetical protein
MLDRLYPFLLFLHLLTVVIAAGFGMVIHTTIMRMRNADRAPHALRDAGIIRRIAPVMPLFALALFLTGAALTHARWSWGQSWVITSLSGLVLMQIVSLTILKPRLQALGPRLAQAGDAPIAGALAEQLRDRVLWAGSQSQLMLVIAIIFVMVMKPGALGGAAALIVAVLIAAGTAGLGKALAPGAAEGATEAEGAQG